MVVCEKISTKYSVIIFDFLNPKEFSLSLGGLEYNTDDNINEAPKYFFKIINLKRFMRAD